MADGDEYENDWRTITMTEDWSHAQFGELHDPWSDENFNPAQWIYEYDVLPTKQEEYIFDRSTDVSVLLAEKKVLENPADPDLWFELSQAALYADDDKNGLVGLQQVILLNPNHQKARLLLAKCYYNEVQPEKMELILREWILNSKFKTTYEKHDQNSSLLTIFLEVREESVDLELEEALVLIFLQQYEYEKALDAYRTLVSLSPSTPSAWNAIGAILDNMPICFDGSLVEALKKEARDAFANALTLKPDYARCIANVGIHYNKERKEALALAYWFIAKKQNSANASLTSYMRMIIKREDYFLGDFLDLQIDPVLPLLKTHLVDNIKSSEATWIPSFQDLYPEEFQNHSILFFFICQHQFGIREKNLPLIVLSFLFQLYFRSKEDLVKYLISPIHVQEETLVEPALS